jgi:glycosyltransferase involved in cell wall biosynthesis
MPKVLRILNRLAIGGPLLNACYLTKYMAPEFETMLVAGEKEGHEKDASFLTTEMGITPVYIPEMGRAVNTPKDYKAYQKLKQIIKEFKPDIVHTHAAKPGALGRMAAKAMKVPVIVHTYHGHVFHSYFSTLKTNTYIRVERYLARLSDAIIAISNQQKKELVEDFKIAPEHKFRVIPLGFNLDKFQTDQPEKRIKFRSEFGIAEDEIAIGIIGRLVPVKNHELFIDALHYVLQNSHKKIKAFIIGDGETRTALENKAKSLGIGFSKETDTNHTTPLIFTSWRSDVDVINAGLDIVALTSLNEGTPVSLIEAQAANKPIVSTRVGGIQDIVMEKQTALLSDINDPFKFKENLLQLVNDDELRKNLGKNGAELVIEKYSVGRLACDMAKLYYELLNKKSIKNK